MSGKTYAALVVLTCLVAAGAQLAYFAMFGPVGELRATIASVVILLITMAIYTPLYILLYRKQSGTGGGSGRRRIAAIWTMLKRVLRIGLIANAFVYVALVVRAHAIYPEGALPEPERWTVMVSFPLFLAGVAWFWFWIVRYPLASRPSEGANGNHCRAGC